MEELWKDIKGYEGLYQISNLGTVRSIGRYVKSKHGGKRWIPGQILKMWECNQYKTVGLYKDRKQQFLSVHRLVAQAFIPNPDNLPEVNHKDENKLNNCVDNLEWCTHQYNNVYGSRLLKASESLKGANCYMYGKIWITNGIINKVVFPQEFEDSYKSQGFYKGRNI